MLGPRDRDLLPMRLLERFELGLPGATASGSPAIPYGGEQWSWRSDAGESHSDRSRSSLARDEAIHGICEEAE
jgi:hypothetical protein